ncbi:MAG: hypothetical protein ACFCBW_07720 [Candidatus Competibacterales bacterium]
MTHDEICQQAVGAFQSVDRDSVISAFVGSLSTRNLPARSLFGSYVVLQHFTIHSFVESTLFSGGECACCGLQRADNGGQTDERVLNYPFQVRHTDIRYATYDLATMGSRVVNSPTDKDRRCISSLLEALRALPPDAELAVLNRSIQGVIKSNKRERMILLETFGYGGILCPQSQRHYSDEFVDYDLANSNQPSQFYKREWAYPIRFWTGVDGVNEDMVSRYFRDYL